MVARILARRPFSVLSSMRSAVRAFDPHAFGRITQTATAPADYARLFKASGKMSIVYVSWYALLLGWPFATARVLYGQV